MAYSKQTWDTTSYVNPTRMNHIEQGIYDADNIANSANSKVDNLFHNASLTAQGDLSIPLGNGLLIIAFRAGNANIYTVDSAGVGDVGTENLLTITTSGTTVNIHNNLGVSCYIKFMYY